MVFSDELAADIIARAEEYPGVRAGLARLEDVMQAPSHAAAPPRGLNPASSSLRGATAASVLVLGLHHPASKPEMDWWASSDSPGSATLRQHAQALGLWLRDAHAISARSLPYHVQRGGLFLKDAATLAGMGVIGHNNLFLHAEFGPRIRLHALLIDAELPTSAPHEGDSPCESCDRRCQRACPQDAFPDGRFSRSRCMLQMALDEDNQIPYQPHRGEGSQQMAIRYCRQCELACPSGAELT